MKKSVFLIVAVVMYLSGFSQTTLKDYKTKTKENATERTQMLDVVRQDLIRQNYPEFKFVVNHLLLKNNFAFFKGIVQYPDGKAYKVEEDGLDCCHVEGLLKKVNGKWKVVSVVPFATDVWYSCLWKEHSAPKEIFDYTDDCD